jgi:hypothetical protein
LRIVFAPIHQIEHLLIRVGNEHRFFDSRHDEPDSC